MNRFNFGNQITNATQILSTGAFTYSGWKRNINKPSKSDASTSLNNTEVNNIFNKENDIKNNNTSSIDNNIIDYGNDIDNLLLNSKSPQQEAISQKIKNNVDFYDMYSEMFWDYVPQKEVDKLYNKSALNSIIKK